MSFRLLIVIVALMAAPSYTLSQVAPGSDRSFVEDSKEDDESGAGRGHTKAFAATALEGAIDPETYVLGPNDVLLLVMRGPDTKVEEIRILPEGNVILPNLGAYPAAGMTLAAFRADVRDKLGRYYRNVDIDFQLAVTREFSVFVLGEVADPGPVQVSAPFRLSQALGLAGGVKANGSLRHIEIREAGRTVRRVDHFAFQRAGVFDENPMLKEGQSVFVPPIAGSVSVTGEVKLPGVYELQEGETVRGLVDYCGGFAETADTQHLVLERRRGVDVEPPRTFSADEADGIALVDMDVIVVPDLMTYSGVEPVQVIGGGGRNGPVYLDGPEPLATFLGRLWRFLPQWDIETALLEHGKPGGPMTHTEFNVRAVLAGREGQDVRVAPGDIVTFPLREENVYVAGEVMKPGEVPFRAGATAEQYVALAGGPTPDGSFNSLRIYSRDGGERSVNRQAEVYRGDTIVVKRRTSKFFGSIFVGITSLSGLIVAIVALSKK